MILGHHGYGEEVVVYAASGAGALVPALALVWRARLARIVMWLRRR